MNIFPDLTPIGYIQKTFGFNGQVNLNLEVELLNPKQFPKFLWFMRFGKPVPYLIEEYKIQKDKSAIVRFEDIHTEEAANHLKGLACLTEEANYDQYFQAEESYDYLMNFSVIDLEAGYIGSIVDVLENHNSHDTLQLDFEGQEVLVPFVEEIILEINEAQKEIKVQLPEGLLDLYISQKS